MRRFGRYPIFTNHPGRWEEVRQRQLEEYKAKKDRRMVMWFTYTAKRLFEITEDKPPRPESLAYENAVIEQLHVISTNKIGRLVLDSICKNTNVYIVPLDLLDRQDCKCGAYTFPGKPNEGGGIRVYYNPTDFNDASEKWIGADDILFHELVHAYRNSRFGYDVVNSAKDMTNYGDTEEFLALQLQNVYLACRGATRFYRNYPKIVSVSKDSAYQFFVEEKEVLQAFRYYVETDPLVTSVSGWTAPADSFNPWRDQRVLERLHISKGNLGVERLPPL